MNIKAQKVEYVSNVYTVLLGLTAVVIIATAVFVAITSKTQYGTFFFWF